MRPVYVQMTVEEPPEIDATVAQDTVAVDMAVDAEIVIPISHQYPGPYTVTPTEEETVLPTEGLQALEDITVEAIPADYVGSDVPRRTSEDLTVSGPSVAAPAGYYDSEATASVAEVPHPYPEIRLSSGAGTVTATHTQETGYVTGGTKGATLQLTTQAGTTVSPTESVQTAVEAGRFTLGAVKVGAIPGDYVGSSIDRRDSDDLTASGATVTVPSGYYAAQATKAVSTTTHPAPSASVDSAGLVTATHTQTEGYVSADTATGTLQLTTQAGTTITPTTSEQTAVTAGKYTTGAVVVDPIPSQYIIPAGTKTITANDTGIDVTEYAAVDVSVSASPTLQTKSVSYTPSESAQSATITADEGYDGLDEVDVSVGAISSTYVGSDIPQNDSTDLSASGDTVSVPAGYYAANASKAVSSGTEGTPTATKGTVSSHSISVTPSVTNSAGYISGGTHTGTAVSVAASELVSGTKSIASSGVIDVTNYASVNVPGGAARGPTTVSDTGATLSVPSSGSIKLTKTNVSITPLVTEGYISSGTATNSSVSLTASVTTLGATQYHPSTSNQTISSGTYLTGAQTFNKVVLTNLDAANIKSGVTVKVGDSSDDDCVASVTGTYEGGGGSGIGTLLKTEALGTISTSSTTATDIAHNVTVTGVYAYDLLIVETSVDTVTNGRHTATVRLIYLTASSNVSTKDGSAIATATWNSRISSAGVTTTRSNTTPRGIYPYSVSLSSNNSGTATIVMYRCYNSTQTSTINGSYTTRVYGVKLYDLIGG